MRVDEIINSKKRYSSVALDLLYIAKKVEDYYYLNNKIIPGFDAELFKFLFEVLLIKLHKNKIKTLSQHDALITCMEIQSIMSSLPSVFR